MEEVIKPWLSWIRKHMWFEAELFATVGLLVSESHDLAAVSWIYIHLRPCGGHVWPGSSIYMSLLLPDSSLFELFSFRAIAFFHFESIYILAKYLFI